MLGRILGTIRGMKICRFDDNRVGVVRGDQVYDITTTAGDALVPACPSNLEGLPKKANRQPCGCFRR